MSDGNGEGGAGGRFTERDLEQQARAAVEDGRAIEKIKSLLEDNFGLREDRRELRSRLDRVPDALLDEDEDALVLTGESVETYERYTDLGEPDEIADEIEAGREARSKLDSVRRREAIRGAADAHGMSAEPLARLADQDGLEVEVREETDDDGDEKEVAFVRGEDDDRAMRLDRYAEENWGEFAPALRDGSGGADDEGDESGSSDGGGGTRFPGQPGETSPPDREPSVEDVVEKKKGSGNYGI